MEQQLRRPTIVVRGDVPGNLVAYAFFIDVASGRGLVAYRRYDGHYGPILAS